MGMSQVTQDRDRARALEGRAEQKFRAGYVVDKEYWQRIFSGGTDIHLSYELAKRLLNGPINSVLATNTSAVTK